MSMWTSASRAPFKLLVAFTALACTAAGEPVLTGMWGAGNTTLVSDAQGGRLQTGCTLVRFAPVRADKDGAFNTSARLEQLSLAPPVGNGEADDALPEPPAQPATLAGRASGGTMTLTLSVEGQAPRTFTLVMGQRGTSARCL
ncbi:MAG: hypothetical protein J7498_09830 [Sphingobium sp.]|nr:hypothetical protein [Sphingobium sp.]